MAQRSGLIGKSNINPDDDRFRRRAHQIEEHREIEYGAAPGNTGVKDERWPYAMDQLLVQLQVKRTLLNEIAENTVLEAGIRRVIPEKMKAVRHDAIHQSTQRSVAQHSSPYALRELLHGESGTLFGTKETTG